MHTVDYDFGLKEVERPVDARERYGEQKIVMLQDEGVTKYSFEDEMIKIVWLPTSYGFDFVLSNRTDHSIKIIWDEAVYVDEKGRNKRVMHSGVKYTERNNPQPPTTIVRRATVTDTIIPTDNVRWIKGYYDQYGSGPGWWSKAPLFPSSTVQGSADELLTQAKQYVGKTFQVLLPLKIEEVVNEYIFIFIVNDVKAGETKTF